MGVPLFTSPPPGGALSFLVFGSFTGQPALSLHAELLGKVRISLSLGKIPRHVIDGSYVL